MTTFWTIVGAVGCAAILLGVGVGLGRWSRRNDIDALEDQVDLAHAEIAKHVEYEDDLEDALDGLRASREKEVAEIRADLARERDVADHMRGLLGERRIGANPVWTQLSMPEPLPIDTKALEWTGSKDGETGAWRTIPRDVAAALDLHIDADPFAWMDAPGHVEPERLAQIDGFLAKQTVNAR